MARKSGKAARSLSVLFFVQDLSIFRLFYIELTKELEKSVCLQVILLESTNRFDFNDAFLDNSIVYWSDLSILKKIRLIWSADYCHFEMFRTLISRYYFLLFSSKKVTLTVHGWITVKRTLVSQLFESLLRPLRKVWVINRSDLKLLSSIRNVELLGNHGFGVAESRILEFPKEVVLDLVGLYIGRWNELKGFHLLPTFFEDCEQRGIYWKKFYVIGNMDDRRRSNRVVKALQSLKKYEYVEVVGGEYDVRDFFNKANFFVLPSRREGISIAMSEAIVNGKFLITYNCRGVIELIPSKFSVPFSHWGNTSLLVDLLNSYLNDSIFVRDYLDHALSIRAELNRNRSVNLISLQYLKNWN